METWFHLLAVKWSSRPASATSSVRMSMDSSFTSRTGFNLAPANARSQLRSHSSFFRRLLRSSEVSLSEKLSRPSGRGRRTTQPAASRTA